LFSSTKHLILIGDHLHLRPKVETYALRTESGSGYDLDKSLFERMLQASYPHTALQQQHRMPPEVSAIVRGLAYPALRDAPLTSTRPPVAGLRNRLVFVPHTHAETTAASAGSAAGGAAARVNVHEARMVAATVRYLLQQGVYKADQIVVLTPNLAQLRLLRDELNAAGTGVLVSAADHTALQSAAAGSGSASTSTKIVTTVNNKMKLSSAGSSGGSIVKRIGTRGVRVATVDNFQGGM
jgi:superfamily I DNA and/or RNA helicase